MAIVERAESESIEDIIESTHMYLAEQTECTEPGRLQLVVSSQARSLRLQIEGWAGGVTKDAASAHLDAIRNGPWKPVQINELAKALDAAVQNGEDTAKRPVRKPQDCANPETFWTDDLWAITLDGGKPRRQRLDAISDHLVLMDLTNPDPACKSRIVAMMGLGDPWISESSANAKTVLVELGESLKRARPPPSSAARPHVKSFPANPAAACAEIDGFAERVYGESGQPSDAPQFTSRDIDAAHRGACLRWNHKSVRDAAPSRPPLQLNLGHGNVASGMPPMHGMHGPGMQQPLMQGMMQMAMAASQMTMMQMMQGGMMGSGMGGGGMMGAAGGGGMMGGMFGGGCGGGMMGGGGGMMGGGGGGAGYHVGARGAAGAITGHRGRLAAPPASPSPNGDEERGPTHEHEGEEVDEEDPDALRNLEQALAGKAAADKGGKGIAKADAGSKAKAKPKAKNARNAVVKRPAMATVAKTAKSKKPHWGYEDSRFQVMCRTGKEGEGQCHAIKYEIAGSKAKAAKLADAWVAKKMKTHGK